MDNEQDYAKVAPEQKLFVGGHWLEGQEWFEVRDKISGDVLASVPICADELFEMAVQAAHDCVHTLTARTPLERAKGLAAWAQSLESQRSTILPLLHREAAIPVLWADEEIRQAVAVLLAASEEAARFDPGGQAAPQSGDLSVQQPLGTVAVVLPARHAFFFAAQLAGVAIATGCPVILMAHPMAPLSVVKLVESAQSGLWPPGSVNLLFGLHKDLGELLAADSRVALLAAAGPTGEREKLSKARGMRPQIQIGSGFGCAILDRGADVTGTVTTLLARRFRSPRWGQAAPVFVLTPEALTVRLHEALGEGVMSLPGGKPTDMTSVVPWQLTEGAAQAAVDWLATVTHMGGKVAFGGRRMGLYVEPAVVTAPAGTRPLPAPPPHAPFFVIDSYDKQPRVQLERFPEITAAAIFTPDASRAIELSRLADVLRVEVFAPGPAPGTSATHKVAGQGLDLTDLLADMTRKKRVDLVFTS